MRWLTSYRDFIIVFCQRWRVEWGYKTESCGQYEIDGKRTSTQSVAQLVIDYFFCLYSLEADLPSNIFAQTSTARQSDSSEASDTGRLVTLDHAISQFYPSVCVALVTLLTYPVSACTAERSFNSMKRLKSPLRSTMTDERLSSLAILHIHKHKNVDIDRFVTEFAHLKGRCLALCLWPVFIVFVFFFFSEHCSLQKTVEKWLK